MVTRDRRPFVQVAIRHFLRQDYAPRKLLIVDDGADPVGDLVPDDPHIRYVRLPRPLPLGRKRNLAAEQSSGELIAHWDDDDWYAPDRLSAQVAGMQSSGLELSGSPEITYFSPSSERAWRYAPQSAEPWLSGNTLLYTREHWRRHPFADVSKGEDGLLARAVHGRAHHPDPRLVLGIAHGGNLSPKLTTDAGWLPVATEPWRQRLGPDAATYAEIARLHAPAHSGPLVSCITPTANRRVFLQQSIRYFLRQDYSPRELVIVDDGDDAVGDVVPRDPRIRYIRLDTRRSIGMKRNIACRAARGDVLVQWDDDDWYGQDRLSHQVGEIAAGRADMTGLDQGLILNVPDMGFWACRNELHSRMFSRSQAITGGTIAFKREAWARSGGYPDSSLAEDADLLRAVTKVGARVLRLPNAGTFVYVRHGRNTWDFETGSFGGREGWRLVGPPVFMPAADMDFYRGLGRNQIPSSIVSAR
jgi:glycosyltransferase involved in cell wall biosynthesis